MSLLERAQREGNPVIDGRTATFVWVGKTPPILAGDFSRWQKGSRTVRWKQAGDIWTAKLEFPADAYVEYAFFESEDDDSRIRDPLNKRRVWNGVNNYNHTFYMPEAKPSPLLSVRRGVPRGKVTRYEIDSHWISHRKTRRLYLYEPPNATAPYPLIVVWDGPDYYKRGRLTRIVDNLIAQKRIVPVGLAMIDNGKAARTSEYMMNEATLLWLEHFVLPFAREHLRLNDPAEKPGSWGVLGASMGGLMSLYTGLRMPHIFGNVLAQSGAFQFDVAGRPLPIFELIQLGAKQPVRIWQDVGKLEFLREANVLMYEALKSRGYEVQYSEFSAGHNYTAWANSLWRGLEWLFKA